MQQPNAASEATPPAGQYGNQAIPQTQPMILTPGTQLMIAQAPRNYEKYATKQSVVLGSIQICCGILSIIFNIVIYAISPRFTVSHAATAIWTGLFFILAGTFGVVASKKKTKCTIVTFMVLSIVATVLGFALLIVSAIAWGLVDEDCNRECRRDVDHRCTDDCWDLTEKCLDDCKVLANCTVDCWKNEVYENCSSQNCWTIQDTCYDKCDGKGYEECTDDCGVMKAVAGMNGSIVCLSLVEIVVSIWSSAICCAVCCCCVGSSYNRAPRIIPVDAQTMQLLQQQVIYIHPGAPGVVMYNPQAANLQQGMYQGTNPMPPPYQPPDSNLNPGAAGYAVAPPADNNQAEPLPTKESDT